jgi:hypothetical protein
MTWYGGFFLAYSGVIVQALASTGSASFSPLKPHLGCPEIDYEKT